MGSEFRKGFVRVASNYARLLSTLVLGLLVVPILLGWLGIDGFGVTSLLGSSVGLAAFFRELTHRSMIRELGAVFHDPREGAFERAYSSACLLAAGVTVLTVLAFGVLFLIYPLLDIPEHLRRAAFWFLFAQGVLAAFSVLVSPAFNMFIVEERFVFYNISYTLQRASNLISALILAFLIGLRDPATSLFWHGLLWAGLDIVILGASVVWIICRDRRLVPRRSLMSREALRPILGTFGWNTGVYVALSLHERVPPLIINLLFGPVWNAVWGVSFRFVSYVRMATFGMQFGADMVTTRLNAGEDEEAGRRVRGYLRVQTRLNSLVALPVAAAMMVLTEPMLRVWLGPRLGPGSFDAAVLTVRILAGAIATRAISEAWMAVLYGAGHVKRYAPLVLLGGVLNPILALVLVRVLPPGWREYAPAIAFTAVISTVNMIALPLAGAGALHIGAARMFLPLWRPVLATALASPLLWADRFRPELSPLWRVLISGGLFSGAYAAMSWRFVLGPEERARLTGAVRRRMNRSGRRAPRPLDQSPPDTNESPTVTDL